VRTAEENRRWVQEQVAIAGLTAEIEAEALLVIAFREELELMV
jgi:hypothetical protein